MKNRNIIKYTRAHMFNKEIYVERRERLAQKMEKGLLLFLGNGIASYNYPNNDYQFRQDSTFLYLFGLDCEGLAAVMDIDGGRTIIFGDELTIDDIIWTGVQPTIAEKASDVGVSDTRPMGELSKYLQAAMASGQSIHFVPPYRGHTILWFQELLGVPVVTSPAEAYVSGKSVACPSLELCYNLADMRNHKAPEEIAEIEEAIDMTVEMHETIKRLARPGVTEKELHAAAMEVTLRRGAYYSFPPICTTHGETLHNHGYIHTLRDGDMLLFDAGIEGGMHYAGDLTTTIPVNGTFSERQQAVYDILMKTYRQAAGMIRPGITYRDCHVAAWASIAEGMKTLGLMKGDSMEAAEAGAVALFMPHGLGHMMGLDVHDMENYGEVHVGYPRGAQKDPRFGFASLRLGRELEPGFVFTVEPGIYFIPDLIDQWASAKKFEEYFNYEELKKWKNFGGMRNEEDYLITSDGARRLGPAKPC